MKISSAELLKDGSTSIQPDFTIFTSAMEIDPEQENVVRMIGSSTERDLHGDTMAISALSDMTQVKPGLTIWLNHSYDLPHDLFGSLLESPTLKLQDGIADISIVSDVETSNPLAVQTYGYIKKGKRLGCSIGCMILEAELDEENDDGYSWFPPLIITHVQTLEWSVVGIPANQRCWVEPAAKGLFERMASQGRGDEALALAPAVKGLYPRAYEDYLKTLNNEALRKDLERVKERPTPKQRVEWLPNERTFAMNTKGVYKPLKRDEVPVIMAKGIEVPRIPGLAKESAPGTAVKSWADIPAPSGQGILLDPDTEPDETKGASGKTSWPLADEDTSWDSGEAHKRIMDWAGGDDPDWSKVKSVHFWFDDEKADTWGGYKLPFCDQIGGSIKAVPKAIYAVAGALNGARGGVEIPDDDIPAVKKKVEAYYHKLDKKAPWEDQEDKEDKEEGIEPGKESAMDPKTKAKETNETPAPSEAITVKADAFQQEPVTIVGNATTPQSINFVGEEGATLASVPLDKTENPANPLDLQLFNALAVRFGQPQLTLDAQGQVQTAKAFPELTSEHIQEAIAKTLNFVDTVKAGNEFSKENREKLQALHNGIVDMAMSSFHPCKEMMKDDPEDGDGPDSDGKPNDGDGDGDDDDKQDAVKAVSGEVVALRAEVGALIETLAKHGIEPKALKELQGQISTAQRQLKDLQSQTKTAEEHLALLKNAPLGQPTLLKRGIQQNGDVATYDDFKALSAASMNANERRWSLDEALRETNVVARTLKSGETMSYRRWPAGVGGTVKDGVRPALTSMQRQWIFPGDVLAYNDGEEAFVPCYDDPLNVEA